MEDLLELINSNLTVTIGIKNCENSIDVFVCEHSRPAESCSCKFCIAEFSILVNVDSIEVGIPVCVVITPGVHDILHANF
jgi:hypothetical protein